MSRYTIFAVIAALCLTATHAATVGQTLTSASFSAPPSQVVNAATGAADATAWGTATSIKFGPSTTNTTVVAYGILDTGSQITSVTVRNINASLVSNGTADTTLAAKIGSDAVYSTAIPYTGGPKYALGLGSIGIAFVANDAATVACSQVWLAVISSAGALTVKKQITSNVCTATCSSTVTPSAQYANTVTGVFYENATYYVTYTTTKTANAYVTSACGTDQLTVTGSLQGIAATSSGDVKWTTAAAIYAGTAAATPAISAAALSPMCYPGNDTVVNSTNFYCTIRNADTLVVTSLVTVPVATGTAGSAVTIATDTTTTAGTYPLTAVAFTPVGFVYSEYQTGVLINNKTTYTATSGGTATYTNTLQLWNLTTGATTPTSGGTQLALYTNTYQSGAYGGAGITHGTGYALLTSYSSAASTINYNFGAFFPNGTLNGTAVTTVSTGSQSSGNWFADTNGALWFGSYTIDDANSNVVVAGYVGKVVAQLYSAGNILASFFAFLSIMIAAVFAF